MSLRDKIPATDFDAWNEKPSASTAGVLGGAGGLVGATVAGMIDTTYTGVVTGLITGVTVLVGFALLALLD